MGDSADPRSDASSPAFNQELVQAGIVLHAEGLQPSAHGKRIRISGRVRTVHAIVQIILARMWREARFAHAADHSVIPIIGSRRCA